MRSSLQKRDPARWLPTFRPSDLPTFPTIIDPAAYLAYLAYDLWIKKRKEHALPTRGIPVGRGVTITSTFGPKSLGLSGAISF